MKSLPSLLVAAFALTALSTAGSAESDQATAPTSPDGSVVTTAPDPARSTGPGPAEPATLSRWSPFKDYTFEQRALLLNALKPLVAHVDLQITELNSRRAAMVKANVNTADWDFAMKEMVEARSYLLGLAAELDKAPSEKWDLQKDRFGQGWLRTQEAYTKVRASTTS
jgi:hypothetical protein